MMNTLSRNVLLTAVAVAMPAMGVESVPATGGEASTPTPKVAQTSVGMDEAMGKLLAEVSHRQFCIKLLESVKDAESAAQAAEPLNMEAQEMYTLHRELMAAVEKHVSPLLEKGETLPAGYMEATDAAVNQVERNETRISELIDALSQLETPYFGCEELKAACRFYTDLILLQLTPEESALAPKVLAAFRQHAAQRSAAWDCINAIHDKASAEAANRQLAGIAVRENDATVHLRSLLQQIPEERVDLFCLIVSSRYDGTAGNTAAPLLGEHLETVVNKVNELRGMETPFYGVPGLEEKISGFVRTPR